MKLNHLLGNTWYIDCKIAWIPFYKINDTDIILLDSGRFGQEREDMMQLIADSGLRVRGIIVTHMHTDHIGAVSRYKAQGAVVAAPEFESMFITSAQNLRLWYSYFTTDELDGYFDGLYFTTEHPIKPEDDSVTICGVTFGIYHTPGHSVRHISVMTPDNVLYLGDALMGWEECKKVKLPFTYSISLDNATKKHLADIPASKYLLAHEGVEDSLSELIEENFRVFDRCLNSIFSLITEEMTMEQIVSATITAFHLNPNTNNYRFRTYSRNVGRFIDELIDRKMLAYHVHDGRAWYYRT